MSNRIHPIATLVRAMRYLFSCKSCKFNSSCCNMDVQMENVIMIQTIKLLIVHLTVSVEQTFVVNGVKTFVKIQLLFKKEHVLIFYVVIKNVPTIQKQR